MIEIENQTEFEIDEDAVEGFIKKLCEDGVEVVFVDDVYIRELNLLHRGKDYSTDVLSFPLSGVSGVDLLGSVVINLDEARRVSERLKHSMMDEISILLIHGVLHLQGYDHESDSGEMWEKELEIAKEMELPAPLFKRDV